MIGAQMLYDSVHIVSTKHFRVATLDKDFKATLVLFVRQIFNDACLQRVCIDVFYTGLFQRLFYAFLNSKKQVVVAMDI